MARYGELVATLSIVCFLLVAGCGELGATPSTEVPAATVTPAPVPGDATPTDPPANGRNDPATQPRYHTLRPTCDRPPTLVIQIQVGALQNNDPRTNEGINTTWWFGAPASRKGTISYANFVRLVENEFRPLLEAHEVTYEPLERDGNITKQTIEVLTTDGKRVRYEWILERQTFGKYAGCWMTVAVWELE